MDRWNQRDTFVIDFLLPCGSKHCAFVGANRSVNLLVDPVLKLRANVLVGRGLGGEASKHVHEVEA